MKHRQIVIISVVCSLFILTSCGKNGGDGAVKPQPVTIGTATLVLPAQNELCTQSVVISGTQSAVQLKWLAAKSADSYEVTLKDLDKNTVVKQTTTATQLNVTLERNTPFSWFVTAKTSSAQVSSTSDVWKFYNPGPGTLSYAPFPAEAVSPAAGENITSTTGKISLAWSGADADNDITSYDVYFGTSSTDMVVLKTELKATIVNDVDVTPGSSYCWKVITKDAKGNSSDSGLFSFKMN